MTDLHFEWDPEKAKANLDKHGISFEEAATVFYDESGVEFYDEEHSEWEDRFLLYHDFRDENRLLIDRGILEAL